MASPMISLANGVLSWSYDRAVAFVVKIDGIAVGGDGVYRETTFDTDIPEYAGRALCVEIEPITGGGASGAFRVRVDAEHKKLSMLPVEDYTVQDGVLFWKPVIGAAGYKVVDVERNAATVADTYYEIGEKKIVYGVYPVSAVYGVADAALDRVDIKYLEGGGTPQDPYLIRTPFDLRTVDYYEAVFAETQGAERNHYLIANDIDYGAVAALEENSNIQQLCQPFYGVLDGGGNRLTGIRVEYNGGHWALFEFITTGAEVKNMVFDEPSVKNVLRLKYYPIDASVATVAHINHGTIGRISVIGAAYSASGGTVSGICTHNHGVISRCSVTGELVQGNTGLDGQACYEMAGITVENCLGGTVERNAADLTVRGMRLSGYVNVCTVGGIVGVNRSGARVYGNTVGELTVTGEFELGGIVGYNNGYGAGCGTVEKLTCNGTEIDCDVGTADNGYCGKLVGKDDADNKKV